MAWGSAGAAEPQAPPPATAESLEAIVVTTEKLAVETLIDRKVYTVTSDAQSAFGNLSDVLNVIPSVDVDADGIVALRGDTHVLILIDGKPSTLLSGSAAGDNLQAIPAKDIQRIEVLTTPPAEFKAEGAAGVINIVTRKSRSQGVSGSVQGSLGTGERSVVGADVDYGSPRLALSATAGYRRDLRQRLIQSLVSSVAPSLQSEATSSISESIRRGVPTAGLGVEYTLNEGQSVSAALNWSERGGLRTYTERNEAATPVGVVTGATRRLSSGHDPETSVDEKLGFTQNLGRRGETLAFALHRSASRQHERYDYTNEPLIPAAPVFYNNLSFREEHTTSEFSTDYALPLSMMRTLKLGYAFEEDEYRFGNRGSTIEPVPGATTIDPNATNDFVFRRQISAAYASYQTSAGAWTWLPGLRAEFARADARQLTDGISDSSRSFNLYPSLHVNYAAADDSTFSFGASRRVTRPDPDNLNPYVDHEYSPNLRAGNPQLRPQYTQSYEVGYAREGHPRSYGITAYYRLDRDSVTDVTEYFGGGVSLTTKTNLPKNGSAGVEFSSSGHIVPKLSYSISGNAFHSQVDAAGLGTSGLRSTSGVNAKFKLDYRPTGANSAQITVTRTDKRLSPQGYVDAIDIVNLGYKHRLTPALTGVATLSDVFDGQRFQRVANSPAFTEVYRRIVRGRILFVGFVYSFGGIKKDKQPNFEYDQSG